MLVVLMLSAATVFLALCLASLLVIENRQAEACERQRRLRRANEAALRRAWAETQATLGPDVAATAPGVDGALRVMTKTGVVPMTGEIAEGSLVSRWEVTDLSMGYDAAARLVAATQASAWAKTTAGRAKLPHALAEAVTSSQQVALAVGGRDFVGLPPSAGASWQVRGLLTDPVRGGWRRNLSAPSVAESAWGRSVADNLRSPAFVGPPMRGYPMVCVEAGPQVLSTMPVLTDFRLSLGFFNARSDGRHRLRFHGSAVFWNPWSVPVLAGPQGKLCLVEVEGLPEVTVTNLETQHAFTVDLDDCPQDDFGIIRQGLRERGLWCWAEVNDPANHGMASRGLLPGEVYALVNPSPSAQPQGLARILTKTTWKMDRTYHGAGWKRPEPTVFLPTDRIEIAIRFRDKVTVRLRAYAGEPARDEAIADYAGRAMLTFRNLSFPDFVLRTTGEDYSRDDSAGYVIEERRACLRFRLRPRPSRELWSADLRKTVWDFAQPSEAAEWVVEHPVLAALDVVDHDASPLMGPLWDLHANRHDADQVGSFASVRLHDFPGWPRLSVGTLRHLAPAGSKEWMAELDRSFFGAPLASPEAGVLSHHPYLASLGQGVSPDTPEAARGMAVVGPFNVNSRDAKEWEAFLRDASCGWKADPGGPFEPNEMKGALFFTRPAGATLSKWGAVTSVDLDDPTIGRLPELAHDAVAGQQSVRLIDTENLARLACAIVDAQATHGWPFRSLQAFAESRLLDDALLASGIGKPYEAIAAELPIQLRAEDLLEAWAPVLTVRGDTFRLTASTTGEGGACVSEMIIQRVAEEHDVAHLGRRFRIISVRFRNR